MNNSQKIILYIYLSLLILIILYVPIKIENEIHYCFIWINNNINITVLLFNIFISTIICLVLFFIFKNTTTTIPYILIRIEPIVILIFTIISLALNYHLYNNYSTSADENYKRGIELVNDLKEGRKLQIVYNFKIQGHTYLCDNVKYCINNIKEISTILKKCNISEYNCWNDLVGVYNNYISGKSKIRLPRGIEMDVVRYSISNEERVNYKKGEELISNYNRNISTVIYFKQNGYIDYLLKLSNTIFWLYVITFPCRYFIYLFFGQLLNRN